MQPPPGPWWPYFIFSDDFPQAGYGPSPGAPLQCSDVNLPLGLLADPRVLDFPLVCEVLQSLLPEADCSDPRIQARLATELRSFGGSTDDLGSALRAYAASPSPLPDSPAEPSSHG